MASIYKRPGTSFWWVKFRNEHGKIIRESTGIPVDGLTHKRRAEEIAAMRTAAEKRAPAISIGKRDHWVTDFIRDRVNGHTSERYLAA